MLGYSETMLPQNYSQPSVPRAIVTLLVWSAIVLAVLNWTSARRTFECAPSAQGNSCVLAEWRILGSKTIARLSAQNITGAYVSDFDGIGTGPTTHTLYINTPDARHWLSNDDLSGGISMKDAADQIKDFADNPANKELLLRAPLPSGLIATGSAFAVITAFLLWGIWFAFRLGKKA